MERCSWSSWLQREGEKKNKKNKMLIYMKLPFESYHNEKLDFLVGEKTKITEARSCMLHISSNNKVSKLSF